MKSMQRTSIERAERLKKVRGMSGLNRKSFSQKYQIPIATMQNWEAPRFGGLSERGARKIIQYLACEGVYVSHEWLMLGVGNGPQIAGTSTGRSIGKAQRVFDSEQTEKEVSNLKKLYKKSTVYELQEEGMLPHYSPGDSFIGVLKEGGQAQSGLVNCLCIVQLEGGERVLRYVKQIVTRGRQVSLYAINMDKKCGHTIRECRYLQIWQVVCVQFARKKTTKAQGVV